MKKMKYLLVKKTKYQKYSSINTDTSYDMKKRKDKESIGTIKFYDKKIIQYVIKKSLNSHFKKLLDLIVKIEEDDDNPDGLLLCLNELEKLKRETNNKHAKFLENKQKEIINKKIEIIEHELKEKIMFFKISKANKVYNAFEEDYEEEKERHRSR